MAIDLTQISFGGSLVAAPECLNCSRLGLIAEAREHQICHITVGNSCRCAKTG